jgi:hypothetical protein
VTLSLLEGIPPELLILTPLAMAAGVDLYLTLLLLGAASWIGWWEGLPGALDDLRSPGVLLTVGGFYLLELAAERWPSTALIWNAFHAIIRPVSGALLALLLLDGQPAQTALLGAAFSGIVASAAHATRTGGGVLHWFDATRHPSRLLISALEDTAVMGMIVLLLDRPSWAFLAACVAALAAIWFSGSQVRAFIFAVRLVGSRVWTTLGQPRWTEPEALPRWVRAAVEGDIIPSSSTDAGAGEPRWSWAPWTRPRCPRVPSSGVSSSRGRAPAPSTSVSADPAQRAFAPSSSRPRAIPGTGGFHPG